MNPPADSIVIVSAKRTPQGRFLGKLSHLSSLDLALHAARAALGTSIPTSAIDLTLVGNCLPPVLNVARQLSLGLGIPQSCTSFTVNMACASGLKAILLAAQTIQAGDAEFALAGGTESMSQSPHFLDRARTGYRLGHGKLMDSLLLGLSDPFIDETMTQTAQRLADRHHITRKDQDAYALASQQQAVKAQTSGLFSDELVPVAELAKDEHPRADTTLEKLASLTPLLGPETTITAGNSSGINDGAAMVVLCKLKTAMKHGWKPLARLTHHVSIGCDPKVMGEGPVHAIQKLLTQSGTQLCDYDAIEINEAFAAQILACTRQLGLSDSDSRLNRNGGGIALGHPIGASGARLAVHLAHRAAKGEFKKAIASLCVGGGMGIAAILEPL